MKEFSVDSFVISIDDKLFEKAVKYGILDNDNREINYHILKNYIRASSCEKLEDLKTFSYENLRASHSNEEVSAGVCSLLKEEIAGFEGTV